MTYMSACASLLTLILDLLLACLGRTQNYGTLHLRNCASQLAISYDAADSSPFIEDNKGKFANKHSEAGLLH